MKTCHLQSLKVLLLPCFQVPADWQEGIQVDKDTAAHTIMVTIQRKHTASGTQAAAILSAIKRRSVNTALRGAGAIDVVRFSRYWLVSASAFLLMFGYCMHFYKCILSRPILCMVSTQLIMIPAMKPQLLLIKTNAQFHRPAPVPRRLRKSGIRAQVLVEVDTYSRQGTSIVRLHVAPLRASRALSLRYFACQHGVPMSAVTVVTCCAAPLSAAAAAAAAPAQEQQHGNHGANRHHNHHHGIKVGHLARLHTTHDRAAAVASAGPSSSVRQQTSKAASGVLTGRHIDGEAGSCVLSFTASDAEEVVAGQQRAVLLATQPEPGCFAVDVGGYGDRVVIRDH